MPTSKHSIGYGNGETQHDERSIPVNVHYEKYNIISDVLHWKICEYGNQQTVKQAKKQKPGTDYNLYDCIVALVKIVQNLHTYIWIQLDFLFMNLQYICQSTES